ncbi:MAG: hypothetical protein FWC10_02145 [Lentimicrobiaceae bacterium]|nr:hypothetical protein [Lentimicrobiaceae bacterium]
MIKKKLREIRDDSYQASFTASTINRQIAFAGIGVVWIFVKSEGTELIIDNTLLWALGFFVGTLALDMLQYIYKSISLYCFFKYQEKKIDKKGINKDDVLEEFVEYSACWNTPTWIFWSIKIVLIGTGYFKLLHFIYSNITSHLL